MSKALTVLAECIDRRSGKRFKAGEVFDPAPTVDQAKRLFAAGCLPEASIEAAADAEKAAEKKAAQDRAEAEAKAKADAEAKAKAKADAEKAAEKKV